jgi:uncharacterized RDD family membrane protein YckC
VPSSDGAHTSVFIDPDSADSSEQQFSASLEEATNAFDGATLEEAMAHHQDEMPAHREATVPPPSLAEGIHPGDESWRDEVVSRVNEYRTRRRRSGRPLPSLAFDFESASDYVADFTPATTVTVHRSGRAAIADSPQAVNPRRARMLPLEQQPLLPKVLEFPKPSAAKPELPLVEELAEPIIDSPRILDVPEQPTMFDDVLAAPIVLDDPTVVAASVVSAADLIEFEIAPTSARAYAFFIDTLVLAAAMVAFGMVQIKLMDAPPTGKFAMLSAFALPFLFWSVYQSAFLFYCGTTPGMQMARLCLIRFDGEQPSAAQRGARAFAMILSACSLGFGFAWSVLDEHRLCWHDRITRTHLVQL